MKNILCPNCGKPFSKYKIDTNGKVWSTYTGRFLTPYISYQKPPRGNYVRVGILKSNGKQKLYYLHALLAATFLKKKHGQQVNHKDGNSLNNRLENLEWVTGAYNIKHAFKTGLRTNSRGEQSKLSKLTNGQARQIKKLAKEKTLSQYKIAEMFGIHRSTVLNIHRGKTYAGV